MLSVHLPESGFTVMRSDWTPDARYMLINHGPAGGGHSHADSLSFQLHAFGQAMAIDSGIGYTYDDPNHRAWYNRSRAHNMLTVDDDDLDRKAAEGRNVVWASLQRLDYFAGSHHGYEASKGIVHRRHIAFARPDYFFVYDLARSTSDDEHSLDWNIHTTSDRLAVVRSSTEWTSSVASGPASVRGIRALGGDYADIPWLRFTQLIGPQRSESLGVVLYPFAEKKPQISVREISKNHFLIDYPAGTDRLIFGNVDADGIQFRGACAVVRPGAWALANGTLLTVGGRSLHESATPANAEGQT
jgi:hypothetical protein